ncbi:MAG TPA: metallophosphoesterase [Candidatus Paceibacterota bacterium]|nr:metallophosphoesterase [Verrucomicrobiota bacterium]HRY50535.1 metallophosphoesterase [Candidatus Paceibacterota bacterium]HSA02069.1 metallophosphoesterase [Candidatus Paceibacterota bacterium]
MTHQNTAVDKASWSRRQFLALVMGSAGGMTLAGCQTGNFNKVAAATRSRAKTPQLSIGLLADCQYAPTPTPPDGQRHYLHSPQKLAQCVAEMNRIRPRLIVHLGDFIDRGWNSLDVVDPIFAQLRMPRYQVLGNHDFDVEPQKKSLVRSRLGMPADYYSFLRSPWRFVVLDGTQVGLPRLIQDTPEYQAMIHEIERMRPTAANPQALQTWNGALGSPQRTWLEQQLQHARQRRQRVIIFCHFPILPVDAHVLWDQTEVLRILACHKHVAAWINGHNHQGAYARHGGIHCLTLKGMVDTADNAFALMKLFPDRLELEGYGRQESRILGLT